jgi:FO synthase
MEETISRMAGSQNGSFKTVSDLAVMVAPTGRQLRQRTTTYGNPSDERLAAAAASDGVCLSVRGQPGRSLPLAPVNGVADRKPA